MLFSALDTQAIILIVLVVVLVAVLIIMPFFTNKKNKKTVEQLHSSLKPGCKVMTIGGIVGTVLTVRDTSPVDKEIVIETGEGDNKSTLTLDVKGIYQVIPDAVAVDNSTVAQTSTTDVFYEAPKAEAINEEITAVQSEEIISTVETAEVETAIEEVSTVDTAEVETAIEEASTVDAPKVETAIEEASTVDAPKVVAKTTATKKPISSTSKTSGAKSTSGTKSTTAKKPTSTKK